MLKWLIGLAAILALAWALTHNQLAGRADDEPSPADLAEQAATERLAARAAAVRHVGDLLDDWHDAAADADLDRYFAHMTPDAVFLGTDATERSTADQFREYARPHFESGRGWTYRPRERDVVVAPDAHVAWFDELLDHDALGLCRGSGVAVRHNGRWKIAQYHLSIPIPNELADEVVRTIRDAAPALPDEP